MVKQKLLVIVGTNASGKSTLGVKLAKDFSGEVISADSRQVYKGLDIGTGKVTKTEMSGVPHHLLDVASPKRRFSLAQFKKLADRAIRDIASRGKLPIIVGGTGYYIDTVLQNIEVPNVGINYELRKKLEKKTLSQLLTQLMCLDPSRYKTVDQKNKRRVIRAIEIAKALGKVPKLKSKPIYHSLIIGIQLSDKDLRNNIHIRLFSRMRTGMLAEAKNLHLGGKLSWRRMEELGLEYKYLALYLQGKLTKEEMLEQLEMAIWQYARRQRTWFKRNKDINWIHPKDYKKATSLTKRFMLE